MNVKSIRQIVGSNSSALETAYLLRDIITSARYGSGEELIQMIREIGKRLIRAQPVEYAVGNTVRRVISIIKEEHKGLISAAAEQPLTLEEASKVIAGAELLLASPTMALSSSDLSQDQHQHHGHRSCCNVASSMLNLLAATPTSPSTLDTDAATALKGETCTATTAGSSPATFLSLRSLVLASIADLVEELETVSSNLSSQSMEHIHTDEVVMTIGRSRSVEKFLLEVGKRRKFHVIVAEAAPTYNGHDMAVSLASAGISTSVIADSAVFAMMARVNKVIIGCHAVTANGGLIASSGTLLLASAAKHHSTPVFVVAGLYKLTPIYPENHDTFNLIGSPSAILPFADGDLISRVDAVNPIYDYVPPTLVNLFVTNMGGQPPSYIYRLLSELYNRIDYNLDFPPP